MRIWLETLLLRAWQTRGPVAVLLWPLSVLFRFIVGFRFGLFVLGYKAITKLEIPVIVVGNIFIGGTGKTPLVIWLVQQLKDAGLHPAVISRGYAASAEGVTLLDASSVAAVVGDEPLLMAERTGCPVAVGRDRVAVARCLLAAHPETDVLIADDGLQHYALGRDIEIVLFDKRGVGNGWMLPAGPLREPVERRRDFTVLNATPDVSVSSVPGVSDAAIRMELRATRTYQLMHPQQQQTLTYWSSKRVCAAAGIGHPQRFFDMLTQAGLTFFAMPLPDHYAFNADVFSALNVDCILITEKDAVKCRQIAHLQNDPRIWVVPVDAHLDTHFAATLIQKISEKKHGSALA
ncbi:tetraacyldisaccharide 4'-kinase [Undibacterium sp. SXout7W]|uniref:tetraacyldisaccharide 4'-kinase n=1 Tax=Undibacterium sp. SXout7W TaxID=3413049 RepID=UPI003BEF561F